MGFFTWFFVGQEVRERSPSGPAAPLREYEHNVRTDASGDEVTYGKQQSSAMEKLTARINVNRSHTTRCGIGLDTRGDFPYGSHPPFLSTARREWTAQCGDFSKHGNTKIPSLLWRMTSLSQHSHHISNSMDYTGCK